MPVEDEIARLKESFRRLSYTCKKYKEEIERLKAELRASYTRMDAVANEQDLLRAEIERLKAKLLGTDECLETWKSSAEKWEAEVTKLDADLAALHEGDSDG